MIKMKLLFLGAVASVLMTPILSAAEDFPSGPVSFVVPFNPGASSDVFARYIADSLSETWSQPVVVENVLGAGGMLGARDVAEAAPDGHKLLFYTASFATNAAVRDDLPFDPETDLRPIARYASGDLIVVAGDRVEIDSLDDLARAAREQTIFFGGTGTASTPTFVAGLLADVLDVEFEGVHYTGGSAALLDVIAGRVDFYIGTVTTVLPAVQDGTVRPLAVFGEARSPLLPDVPTIAEAGYPDATTDFWFGVFGPGQMSSELTAEISADIGEVMQREDAVERFERLGAKPEHLDDNAFADLFSQDLEKWRGLAERFNISEDK